MLYFVKDVIELRFTKPFDLSLDKRHVGQYTRQCALVQSDNLLTRQRILSLVNSALSQGNGKHTINHRLILIKAFRYAPVLNSSFSPINTESTYAVKNVIISNT